MKTLRVAQVGAFPFPTHQGSQVYVAGMAQALARRGHEVRVLCWGDGHGQLPEVEICRTPRVPGSSSRSGPHWSRIPQDLLLSRALRRLVREWRPHVLHLHNVEAPVAAWAACRGDAPLRIYNLHTTMGDELPTYLPGRGRRPARLLGGLIDRVVPRLAHGNIAISPHSEAHLRQLGAANIALVYPGVDCADVRGGDAERARQRWSLGDERWVLYAGNTDGYQDLDILLRSAPLFETAGLLLVSGSDLAPIRTRLIALGMPAHRMRLVETRDFDDVRDAMAAAHLAVVPRTHCAGFPIKLLNQLAAGLPTICAAGSSQAIPGIVTVPNHQPVALAAAVDRIDSTEREALSKRAMAAVERDWTWDVRAAEIEAYYRRLLASA